MESIEVSFAELPQGSAKTAALFECDRDASFISPDRLTIRRDAQLSKNKPIQWVKGENLVDLSPKWVPTQLFDLDFSKIEVAPIFLSSSNGLASGNTRTEAIIHGLCEAIERDQISFWSAEKDWLGSPVNRRIMINSIEDPVCKDLVEKCQTAGLDIFIWYISINIDIPVFACTIADQRNNTQYPQHATGHGCHPIATVALARAITEAAQSRLTHISGLREDLTWSRYRNEFSCAAGDSSSLLAKISKQPSTVDFDKIRAASEDCYTNMPHLLQNILETLRRSDLGCTVVVDLASNEIFSVVFVCVPGLEHRSHKASMLYVPGFRMREYLKQKR
jgi:ribosomal protein S12 methylthiotransferase accessory factor